MFVLALILGIISSLALPESKAFAADNSNVRSASVVSSLSTVSPLTVTYAVNRNLSQDEVVQRFEKINSSYKIGQPFSPEDAEFVKAYAPIQSNVVSSEKFSSSISGLTQTEAIKFTSTTHASFSKEKDEYGVGIRFTGTLYSTIGIINHSYRGNMTCRIISGSSRAKRIKLTVTNIAYGLLGNSGTYVGIIYNGQTSSSKDTHTSWSMDKTVKYGAIGLLYTYTNAFATITTSKGSYNKYAF